MKKIYKFQSAVLLFVGIGALFGGALAITDPYGISFGMPADVLKKGPFNSFLIPGLFLFLMLGIGQIASSIFVMRRLRFHVYISGGAGCILMAWILTQVYILNSINILHIIYFLIGLVESLTALYMLIKLKQFPFNKQNQSHSL